MSKFFEVDFRTGSIIETLNRNITIYSSPSPVIKKQNKGFSYLSLSNNSYLSFSSSPIPATGACSIVMFYKAQKVKDNYSSDVLNIFSSATVNVSVCMFGRILFQLGSSNYRYFINTIDSNWHCLILSIPGSNQTDILSSSGYLDNTPLIADSTLSTSTQDRSSNILFGRRYNTDYGLLYISYTSVYDHILTEQERNDIYADFLRSYPTHKKQTQIEYSKPNDLSREKDSVISNNLLLPGTTTNYYANDVAAWILYGSNTKTQDGNAVKIDYVSSALGAYCLFRASSNTVAANPFVGVKYKLKFRYKVTGTLDIRIYNGATFVTYAGQTNTDWVEREAEFFCAVADNCYMAFLNMSAGESVWVEFLEFKSYQGLVAAYNFKPIRNILVDISGNGYNMTNYATNSTKQGIDYSKTKLSYSQLTSALSLGATYSILMRIIPKSVGSAILGNESSTTNQLTLASSTQIRYRTLTGSLNQNITAITIGKEITLAFTRNNTTTLTSYVDMVSYTGTLSDSSNFSFRNIGKLFSDYGDIEMIDLRIYNYAVSEQQIKDYHNSFAKQVYLQEDFSNNGADGTVKVPYGWYKGSGSYKVEEYTISSGELNLDPTLDNPSNWLAQPGWTISGGKASANLGAVNWNNFRQSNTTKFVVGHVYKIKYTVKDYVSGTVSCRMGTGGTTRNSNGVYEDIIVCTTSELAFAPILATGFVGSIDDVSCIEIFPLSTFTNGTRYLQCTTAGTIALPSKQAYGTWEFDVFKGDDATRIDVLFINDRISQIQQGEGYYFSLSTNEQTQMIRSSVGGGAALMYSINSYIQNFTWYRIKITRTVAGSFSLYIKGGNFGKEYVLCNSGAFGTNPATDSIYTKSNFFVLGLYQGDRIANIIMRKGIEV